jgi:hypothetical protein
MSEEQLNASLDAETEQKLVEEGAEDVELTDEELAGVAGGMTLSQKIEIAKQRLQPDLSHLSTQK